MMFHLMPLSQEASHTHHICFSHLFFQCFQLSVYFFLCQELARSDTIKDICDALVSAGLLLQVADAAAESKAKPKRVSRAGPGQGNQEGQVSSKKGQNIYKYKKTQLADLSDDSQSERLRLQVRTQAFS